jgi:hypothetical protein
MRRAANQGRSLQVGFGVGFGTEGQQDTTHRCAVHGQSAPYEGWRGSLGEAVAEQRLAACIRDSCLPARELVAHYLPGMFSERPPPGVAEQLAEIMVDTHTVGFRLMAAALADGDMRSSYRSLPCGRFSFGATPTSVRQSTSRTGSRR